MSKQETRISLCRDHATKLGQLLGKKISQNESPARMAWLWFKASCFHDPDFKVLLEDIGEQLWEAARKATTK